jgi:membrane fusion protein, copper/silver efflux system
VPAPLPVRPWVRPTLDLDLAMKFLSSFLCLSLLALLVGCKPHADSAAPPGVDYYTCTMHPSVHSHDPNAKCPICSMDLVPVMKKGAAGPEHGVENLKTVEGTEAVPHSDFFVPVERQQQIGVTYAEARVAPLHRSLRAVGMVSPDRTRRWDFVARTEGYVRKLFVTSPGESVRRDQPLLTIYSPDLFITERELVSQLESRDRATSAEARANYDRLIDSSRRRLAQWNITDPQIAALEKARTPSEFLTFTSPFDGVVERVPTEQGRKVMPGDPLVSVADLSLVWVWAEFYENEVPLLVKGRGVTLTAASYPGETFQGSIALVDPFFSERMRTARVRLDIANPGFKLRPGMYVNVGLAVDAGQGLCIPVSAVMPTVERTLVFVDKGGGKLEPRRVLLGEKFGEFYEVKDGLKEGEKVVASANFLIDAESKVQGAVKSFEEPSTEGQRHD